MSGASLGSQRQQGSFLTDPSGFGRTRLLFWGASLCWALRAYRGADLAVLRSHAVSVVQVCEGLGCPPGLQVPGHADRSPHLCSIKRVSRSEEVLRAPPLSLGVRNAASHLEARRRASSLQPPQKPPMHEQIPLPSLPSPCGLLPPVLQGHRGHGHAPEDLSEPFSDNKTHLWLKLRKNNSHWKGRFHNADS